MASFKTRSLGTVILLGIVFVSAAAFTAAYEFTRTMTVGFVDAVPWPAFAYLGSVAEVAYQAVVVAISLLAALGCATLLKRLLREIAIRCALQDDLRRHYRLG